MFGKDTTLTEIADRELRLLAEKQTMEKQLTQAKQAAGLALVDGNATTEIGDAVQLRIQMEGRELAINILRERRRATILSAKQEAAKKIRSEQSEKRSDLETLSSTTAKLLAQLSVLEGVKFDQSILGLQPTTDLGVLAGCHTTKSEDLRMQISALEQRAIDLEQATVPDFGHIELEDVTVDTAVLRAVLMHESAGPSAEAIHQWIGACAKSNRVPDGNFGDRPRSVRLSWNRGGIAPDSHIFCRELGTLKDNMQTVGGGTRVNGQVLNVETCTFRPAAA